MPEEVVETGAAAAEGTPAGGAPATDPFDDAKVESFDRKYVESLRQEAADRRTRHQPYEQAFNAWTEDDRSVWLESVALAAQDPVKGAERLREIAESLSPSQARELGLEPSKGQGEVKDLDPDSKYLTNDQLDERLKRERLEQETATQLTLIKAQAKDMGYEDGSEEYWRLMWVANNVTKGDLSAADKHMKDERQKIVDDFIAEKRAQAENNPLNPQGRGGRQENPIKNFKDARGAVEARLEAARGGL